MCTSLICVMRSTRSRFRHVCELISAYLLFLRNFLELADGCRHLVHHVLENLDLLRDFYGVHGGVGLVPEGLVRALDELRDALRACSTMAPTATETSAPRLVPPEGRAPESMSVSLAWAVVTSLVRYSFFASATMAALPRSAC